MIEFNIQSRSGVPAYMQIVQQVRQAIQLGILAPGDQLPTVKEVVAGVAINPNTVLKAYRELDLEGLVDGRRGVGTFVAEGVVSLPPKDIDALRKSLAKWVAEARGAGLDDESMSALFAASVDPRGTLRVA
jgi:GntR family transcriptional regulator